MGQGYSHGEDQGGVRRQPSAKKPGPDVSVVRTTADNPSHAALCKGRPAPALLNTKRGNAMLCLRTISRQFGHLRSNTRTMFSFQFFSLRHPRREEQKNWKLKILCGLARH